MPANPEPCIVCATPLSHGNSKCCSVECRRVHKQQVARRYYDTHKDKWRIVGRERRTTNAISIREYQRKWRQANVERSRAYARASAAKRVAKQRAWLEQKRSECPGYTREIYRRHIERKRAGLAKQGRPRSDETRQRMSVAQSQSRKPLAPEHKAKLSAVSRGRQRPTFSVEWRAKIGAAQTGRQQTPECRAKRAESLKRAWEEGRKTPNVSYRYTSLARALHAYLEGAHGITLEPEVRFGRYTVDLYDRTNHVAYEADGRYWHERNEAAYPGYHANRDAYLMERFALPVHHFTDDQIATMRKGEVA